MMIKGRPCKVLKKYVCRTGKLGYPKCQFTATDIFTGQQYDDFLAVNRPTSVPIVNKSEWEVIDIDGDDLTLMNKAGDHKTDLELPTRPEGMAEEIRNAWNGGENYVAVTVFSAVGIEQVVAYKKE